MSQLDELKEQIAYLKLLLGISIATGLSLLGWIYSNFEQADPLLIGSAIVAIIAVTVGMLLLDLNIRRKIRQLRDI